MPTITVGVLAAHEDAKHLAERLTDELSDVLRERHENAERRHATALAANFHDTRLTAPVSSPQSRESPARDEGGG
jgi:hypothetical protein